MNKQFPRLRLLALVVFTLAVCLNEYAQAGPWLGGGYRRWYGWAGPLYGGFGGYPGARYVSGAAYGWGPGCWGCDCWSGCAVGLNVTPSPSQGQTPIAPAVPGNSVIMDVTVPPDARVYVNGLATTTPGSQRRFRSDNLNRGTYPYEVRAEIERDGQKLVQSKIVRLRTGQSESVVFDFTSAAQTPLPTALTVHVPEGAKVFLGDNPTRSTGSVRRFATTLKPGERYENYKVRVETRIGGKLETREQVISLTAGDSRELKFDFAPLVAGR